MQLSGVAESIASAKSKQEAEAVQLKYIGDLWRVSPGMKVTPKLTSADAQ